MLSEDDRIILACPTYDDYLDTHIARRDLSYMRNIRICRTLIQHSSRRTGNEVLTKQGYEERRQDVIEKTTPTKMRIKLFSDGMTSEDPVLRELAARERPNLQKVVSTIIFLKNRIKSGFEVSSYKDYEESLRNADLYLKGRTDWEAVFNERAVLRPKRSDLSFYNAHKDTVEYNDSDNYIVHHDRIYGLTFLHKGDHKKICVNASDEKNYLNFTRTMYFSKKYGHVVFYDHLIRRKI